MRTSISLIVSFLTALLIAACGDTQVAGTSSGVDNPSLTVGFRDASGSSVQVTGDLDVYSLDQNPAVDPEPLVTVKIRNASFTSISSEDFARLGRTAAKQAAGLLAKTSADSGRSAWEAFGPANPVVMFNLVLKTQDRTGSLASGFKYDSAAKTFSRLGGGALTRVEVQPKPLIRYQARVARESVHGGTGRMFVPGTPFLATLIDSTFTIEDMPQGMFPLRFLAGDGNVYPFRDSLDTRDSVRIYRPLTVPIGVVDTTVGMDSIPDFKVVAEPDHEGFLDVGGFLVAKMSGIDPGDSRLSFLWTQIQRSFYGGFTDTAFHDSMGPKPGPGFHRAFITSPTRLNSEVKFEGEGVYEFQIAATLGFRVRTDTVVISVRRLPQPIIPRVIQPEPGDSLLAGRIFNIQWEMPRGPVTVQVSLDSGATWLNLAQHKDGPPYLPWTPSRELGASRRAFIKVFHEADTSLVAIMPGPFNLLQ
jgi:hypothetical protein